MFTERKGENDRFSRNGNHRLSKKNMGIFIIIGGFIIGIIAGALSVFAYRMVSVTKKKRHIYGYHTIEDTEFSVDRNITALSRSDESVNGFISKGLSDRT